MRCHPAPFPSLRMHARAELEWRVNITTLAPTPISIIILLISKPREHPGTSDFRAIIYAAVSFYKQGILNVLSNRSHFACYNGCNSSILPVLSGVPQGSILGPLLFLIYVNYLPISVRSASCFLFADDTKLLHTIKNEQLFRDDIHQVESWCQQYKIYLNTDKCNILHFSRTKYPSQRSVFYTLDGATITAANTQRDLGIIVNSDLSWTDHLNHICLKAYRSLNLIRRTLSTSSPVSLKKRLYISLVHSHLSYCSQLWRPHLIKDITNIERVQRSYKVHT